MPRPPAASARGESGQALRLRRIVHLCLILLAGSTGAAFGAGPTVDDASVYAENDTLWLDATLGALFSGRSLDAIETGMATTVGVEIRVMPLAGRRQVLSRQLGHRMDHDIWEDEYRVIRYSSIPDTLLTSSFEEASRFCANLNGVFLGPAAKMAGAADGLPLRLELRTTVNPVSPEQEARTRRWLDILERGSLLELFVSLKASSETSDWLEVLRFSPADLVSEDANPAEATP